MTINTGTSKWYKYSKLSIISEVKKVWRYRTFRCLCTCWVEKNIRLSHLRSWHTTSCGCSRTEKAYKMSNTPFYRVWIWILQRCWDKNHKSYKDYGWRWITCRWNNFKEFYKDMYATYESWLTIDRINNNWDYSKDNCRRATRIQQNRNTRRNRMLTYNWKTMCLTDWCKELWISNSSISHKLYVLKLPLIKALWLEA